ncbi:MAG: Rieske 2Fe-2S domain-containing protein [Verrucomicrobiota bacterium]
MSATYTAISWNRQKRIYDATLGALLALALGGFMGLTLALEPRATIETLIIRATAVTAFLLLHVILCLGPLARLDRRFLPLLYNRRHLGVTMFLLALVHAAFATIQFHALGDTNPLVSVFTAYARDYTSLAHFPFEPLGAGALVLLFLMAATSHDFWLKTLGASVWKLLHFAVYPAYGLILAHVAFGALHSERSTFYPVLLGAGFVIVFGLHLAAWRQEAALDAQKLALTADGFADACAVDDVAESHGRPVNIGGERLAVWRHQGRIFATANVCRHQGGPLGEGRILDGCITCPWHGWQYRPEDGCSPPPFAEIIATHDVRIVDGRVFVRVKPNPLKTVCPGADIVNRRSAEACVIETGCDL